MNRAYIVSILVGFVLVLAFYMYTRTTNEESFVDSATATTTSTGTSTATTATAAGSVSTSMMTLLTMPQTNNVVMYTEVFDPAAIMSGSTWSSDIPSSGSMAFLLSGSIDYANGLQTSSVELSGPSSSSFTSASDFRLTSFTTAFYGTINSFTAMPVVMFIMHAETSYPNTPNMIEISIDNPTDQTDTTHVNVMMDVGNVHASWIIPKSTILTGQKNLYTFVYDNDIQSATFYIGTSAPYTYTIPTSSATTSAATATSATALPPPVPTATATTSTATTARTPIILGNSNMKVNSGNRNLDMGLYAFVYYNIALSSSDQLSLYDYFTQQASGVALYIKEHMSASASLANIKNQFTSNLSMYENALSICQSSLQTANLSNVLKNPWQITLDDAHGAGASLSDMYKCSPLAVKKYGDGGGSSNIATSNIDYPQLPSQRYRVPYPPNTPSTIASLGLGSLTNIINPTIAPTTATTTSNTTASTSNTSISATDAAFLQASGSNNAAASTAATTAAAAATTAAAAASTAATAAQTATTAATTATTAATTPTTAATTSSSSNIQASTTSTLNDSWFWL